MGKINVTLKLLIGFLFQKFGGIYLVKRKVANNSKLFVFNYHSFSRYNNFVYNRGDVIETGFAANFDRQMKFLSKHFNTCTPEEFFNRKVDKKVNVFVTFDDGYKDNYDIAFPVLKKHGIKSAFFIVTSPPATNEWLLHDKIRFLIFRGFISSQEGEGVLKNLNLGHDIPLDFVRKINDEWQKYSTGRLMMNWREVNELHQHHFIVGSHTVNHNPLIFLCHDDMLSEIQNSKSTLELKINKSAGITHFAYPNGLFNDLSQKLLIENGFEYIYTTISGVNSIDDSPKTIKRIGLNASDSIGIILLKMYLSFKK